MLNIRAVCFNYRALGVRLLESQVSVNHKTIQLKQPAARVRAGPSAAVNVATVVDRCCSGLLQSHNVKACHCSYITAKKNQY